MWKLFTLAFLIRTINENTLRKLIFSFVAILFALQSLARFTGSEQTHTIAGYGGILCNSFAFYEVEAVIIDKKLGRTVLPL